MVWKPHVTVAALAQDDAGRFLFVEERADGRIVLNQPAGHLEPGETLTDAVRRETLEETAWQFEPEALVGIYRWHDPANAKTFLRVTFTGRAVSHDPGRALDDGILRALWLDEEALRSERERLRSPLVWRCIEDFGTGRRFPLELLQDL